MDVASISMNFAQSNMITDVGTAMLSKSIEITEVNGAQLVEMIDTAAMERSVAPNIGANFDASI